MSELNEPELRRTAIKCAVARQQVAVYYTGPTGAPCVRVGKVVSVVDRHLVISSGAKDEPQGIPFTAVVRIEPLAAAPAPGGHDAGAGG